MPVCVVLCSVLCFTGGAWLEEGEMGLGVLRRNTMLSDRCQQTLLLLVLPLGPSYVSDGREYTFYINVCGTKGRPCNNKEAAVCQEKKADSTQVKIAGRHQNQTLR